MKILKITTIVVAVLAALAGGTMLIGCATFGTNPAGPDLVRMERSPQWDPVNQRFDNPTPEVIEALEEMEMNFGDIVKFFFAKGERTPDDPMPQVRPDLAGFSQANGPAQAVWFGHSSLLLRMAGQNILVDPVFSKRASPVPFTVGRFQPPVAGLEDLPEIDVIVISHDHYDHLDMETVKHFRDRKAHFLVPLGVGSHLRGWGVDAARITELDWWDSVQLGSIEFACTPAHHFSGRGLKDRNKTLWASWVIRDADQSIFYSGDSGYGPHFRAIGEAYGPFDAAFIETGQYNKKWREVHMLPEEAAQAYFDLGAKMYIPVHWAMFELSMHTWYQPAMEISEQALVRGINLVTPQIGEAVILDGSPQGSPWWQPWIDPSRPREWYAQKVS